MKSLTHLVLIAAVAALSLSQAACSSDAQSKNTGAEEETPAVPVAAASVTTGEMAAFFTGTASLEAEEEALVVAKAGGVVEKLFVEEGQFVKAGKPLAKLDDERPTLELARAEAELGKLEQTYRRNEGLYDKQLVSAEEFERLKADYEAQKVQRDLAQLAVEHTTVRAPISGIVSERLIKVGNMVTTNEPTFRLTDFEPLLAILHVPERELNKLRTGQRAELRLDALSGEVFAGSVLRISPVVDAATGTFKVTVAVRNPSRTLKPGMFGRVQIVYDTRTETLLMPKEALLAEDDEDAVFIVRDSLAIRQIIQTGYSNDTHVEVTAGLQDGDVVITTGQNSLRDSSKVEVIR